MTSLLSLPPKLQTFLNKTSLEKRVTFRVENEAVQISLDGRNFKPFQPSDSGKLRHRVLALRLDADEYLRRTVKVPAAVAGRLAEALQYSLHVWTPFKSDSAYAAAREVASAGPLNITVELRCALRVPVDEKLRRLPVAVHLIEFGEEAYAVPLSPQAQAAMVRHSRTQAGLALLAGAFTVAILYAWEARLASRADAYESAVSGVMAIRKKESAEFRELAERQKLIVAVAGSVGGNDRTIAALAELGSVLPQGASIQELDIDERGARVSIAGLPQDIAPDDLGRKFRQLELSEANVRNVKDEAVLHLVLKRRRTE